LESYADRFSLTNYGIKRSKEIGTNTVLKDFGNVTLHTDSQQEFIQKLTERIENHEFLQALILLMENHYDGIQEYLSQNVAFDYDGDIWRSFFDLYIHPAECLGDIIIDLLRNHWEVICKRETLFTSIIKERLDDLESGDALLNSIGVVDQIFASDTTMNPIAKAQRLKMFHSGMEKILLKIGNSARYFITESTNGEVKVNVDRAKMRNLNENEVETLILLTLDSYDWMSLAAAYETDGDHVSAFQIYRVFHLYGQLPDPSILGNLLSVISSTQVPPVSLLKICHDMNEEETGLLFLSICQNEQMQKEVAARFSAEEILEFAAMSFDELLQNIDGKSREVARKCLFEYASQLDIDQIQFAIQTGFWDIADMDYVLPQYAKERSLTVHFEISHEQNGDDLPPEQKEIINYHEFLPDYVQNALDDHLKEPQEDMEAYMQRIAKIAVAAAATDFGDTFDVELAFHCMNGILPIYIGVKEMEYEILSVQLSENPEDFLLNTSVKSIVHNPVIPMETRQSLLIEMFDFLNSEEHLFTTYFHCFYDIVECGAICGLHFPCDKIFENLNSTNLTLEGTIASCLSFATVLFKMNDTDYMEIIEFVLPFIHECINSAYQKEWKLTFAKPLLDFLLEREVLSLEVYNACI
jgi:hypothetical protein